jgi:dihydroneopterin aldolase
VASDADYWSVLEVPRARLRVTLGWEAAERARPQSIDLRLRVEFARPPRACESDELADTICYAALLEQAQRCCEGREFRLIEHLAHTLLQALRPLLPPGATLELTVSKPHAPVPALREGVRFTLRCAPPSADTPAAVARADQACAGQEKEIQR